MTLEQLKVLVKVVQSGSFTRAAELLQTQKAHVSRVIAQLEAELGGKLLERTTRTLSVTETGREVVERAIGILAAVEDTAQLVHHSQGEPRGLLRLTCGVEFGMLAVSAWVHEYLATYPAVTVEVEHAGRVLDLVHEGFDLAIRVGEVPESRLVARQLGQLEYALFACPRYLARHGRPEHPTQLREHALVMFTGGSLRRGWQLTPRDGADRDAVRVDPAPRLRVNNTFVVRHALLQSLGIGALPLLVAAEGLASGRLVPVLPDWQLPAAPVHAVYPSNRYLSPKVRAFVDLALQRFPHDTAQAREVSQLCRPGPSAPTPGTARASARTAASGRTARR